ncbi:MAG: sterol desaturase family protein [Flavobacteriales bacterium]
MTQYEVVIGTVGILLASNLFGVLYSFVVLRSNLFSRFRIQKKKYKEGVFGARFGLYFFNLVVLMLFSAGGAYALYDYIDTSFGSGWIIVSQVVVAFVIDDIYFYFMHRYFHENKFLLKTIHSIHHRSSTPFPLEYLYAHPLEWMIGMIGSAIAFILILAVMPINVYAFWAFGVIRNLHEIHIHSDLELPVLSWIPLISKTRHHDDHHAKLDGNYSSTFLWWDKIFKTELKNK